MKPIISNDRIQTLRPHPEEAALFARPSRRMASGTISLAAVLRDARILRQALRSALLRTRLMGDIDMTRTMETLCLSDDALDHLAAGVRQAEIAALVVEGQLLVVET